QVAVGLGLVGGRDREGALVDVQVALHVADRVVAQAAAGGRAGGDVVVRTRGGVGGRRRVAAARQGDARDAVAVHQLPETRRELGSAVRREQVAVGLGLVG